MGPRWPFRSHGRVWEEGGSQREQRGLPGDNDPSVQPGLLTAVGGLALVTAPLCGGQGGGLTSREALPLAVCGCQWTLVPEKGQVRAFFKFICRQCLLSILLGHGVLWVLWGWRYVFTHSTGGTFLWELGWEGQEERIPLSSYVLLPTPPLPKAQQRTSWAPPRA